MGSTTTNYDIYKPAVDEEGWGGLVNTGFDDIDTQMKVNADAIALNTTHKTSNGSDHSYIDQDVTNGSAPVLSATNFTNLPSGTPEGTAILSTGEVGGTKFLREDGDGTCSWQVGGSTPEGTAVLSTGEVGAVKYLREDGDGTCSWQAVSATGGLQTAFDAGQSITIADTDNQTLAITNNDTTNNPVSLQVINTTSNSGIKVIQNNSTAADDHGLHVINGAAVTGDALVAFTVQPISGDSADVLQINNAGTGKALAIINSNAASTYGLEVVQSGVLTSGGKAVRIYSNAAQTNSNTHLMQVIQDHASSDERVVGIQNDGTGIGLEIDQNGAGRGLFISNAGTSSSAQINTDGVLASGDNYGLWVYSDAIQNASSLAQFRMDNASSDQTVVEILNDGTGAAITTDSKIVVGGTGDSTFTTDVVVEQDLYTTAWVDYKSTSTIVGWASTTGYIKYKKVGNLMFVQWELTGTSNATTATFTLPYTNTNNTVNATHGYCVDNGSVISASSKIVMVASGAVVSLRLDQSTTAWTASGTKTSAGQFWYEATT